MIIIYTLKIELFAVKNNNNYFLLLLNLNINKTKNKIKILLFFIICYFNARI